jgi:hypothetical protein
MGAIAACRTAALGGHPEQRDDCGALMAASMLSGMASGRNGSSRPGSGQ